MTSDINWLEPWESLTVERNYFKKKLYREISKEHILFNKTIIALGRRYDCDDVYLKYIIQNLILQ
jgi:hypothetical protein